ncbi:MAG: DUF1993 domain-containing protein [Patescibacteria group bacterium]
MEKINLYNASIPPLKTALQNLSGLIDKAVIHADMKKGEVTHLFAEKLVFDQFPLSRQIRMVCDNAKGTAARLAGIDIPKFADEEKTAEEFKVRIEKTIAFLDTIKPEQIIGNEEIKVTLPYFPGKHFVGLEYLTYYALPNFYFHLTTAYSILRKNGVDIGKSDYLSLSAFLHDE